jgi:hypothetical protein
MKTNTFFSASRIAILGLAAGVGGCMQYDHSGAAVVAQWNGRFGPNAATASQTTPWPTGRAALTIREFAYEGIAVKDYEYKKYIDLIRRGTSWGGFGAQTATLGINAAGTLTSGGTTRTLSAIAATITGTSAAFGKSILFDQSVPTFIAKMDALRVTKLREIEKRLDAANYTFAEAYRDIQDYGYQGSLDAALSDINKKAGQEEAAAKKKEGGGGGSSSKRTSGTRETTTSTSETVSEKGAAPPTTSPSVEMPIATPANPDKPH